MERTSVQPNATSYNSLINARAQKGDVARADQRFRRMEKASVQPNETSHNSVIHACAQEGDI